MPRTSLPDFALDILDLVSEKLVEANNTGSRLGALVEANCGLRMLKERLRKEDQTRFAQFILVADVDLEGLKHLSPSDFDNQIRDVRESIVTVRSLFETSTQ